MLNVCIIQGRLVRDPELRQTPNGVAVATFTLAVDREFKTRDGEKQTDFVNIVAWRNTGEFVAKYFAKGQMCALTGSLQMRNYTDKDGNKRTAAEVIADHVFFAGDKPSRGETQHATDNKPQDVNQLAAYSTEHFGGAVDVEFSEIDGPEEDLPF